MTQMTVTFSMQPPDVCAHDPNGTVFTWTSSSPDARGIAGGDTRLAPHGWFGALDKSGCGTSPGARISVSTPSPVCTNVSHAAGRAIHFIPIAV